ncbi:hypothetical protein O6H91_18G011700 [Diphasiastrum complanatum]|uniref:Uncharacterized protein n=1 Tax=Diphasiastrum complanatum TaxID=34168 RepID=A0ACC2AZG5_DIPCM|nr:hypothetical protein O6H91_18G011700 [Diphasiastrum complanatum]
MVSTIASLSCISSLPRCSLLLRPRSLCNNFFVFHASSSSPSPFSAVSTLGRSLSFGFGCQRLRSFGAIGRRLDRNRMTGGGRFHALACLAPVEGSADAALGAENSTKMAGGEDDEFLGYRLPPKEIKEIVDAPPIPALSLSPKRDKILFLHRPSLPPLSELARQELKLAGLRIDPECNTLSRMSSYTGISIHTLLEEGTLREGKSIMGLPDDAKISSVSWSPDGRYLAFSICEPEKCDLPRSTLGLWIADVENGQARELLAPPKFSLNKIFNSYSWIDDSTLVVSVIPSARGLPPKKPVIPFSPKILSNEHQQVQQNATYQDLLKNMHDEDLFDYYATAQLLLVTLDGETKVIGPPAIYTSVDPSPDGRFLLVSSIHRPYSYILPWNRFPKKVHLWKRTGEFYKELCSLPLAENIPIAFNSCRKGPRSINWRADKPSSLYWVEAQDEGDARVNVSPRDIIYTAPAELQAGEEPNVVHKLDLRYGGVLWGTEALALVYESWYKTRRIRTWRISPENPEEVQILFDRSTEDVYSDPGSPMLRRTSLGTYVLAQIKLSNGKKLLLNGKGATPEGYVPFLDLFDINTGETERIWQSDKEKYYEKLAHIQKEILRYTRSDEVQLTATLYLPPGYEPKRDGPLPTLIWAYPREFKNKDNAGQMRGSPNQFPGIGSTSPLLWLARGFAILEGPTMPIIGEGEAEANDRYVEQLVASAEAAVNEIMRRGVSRENQIAVGGHSYGAFMTANLLAHAPHLFCCGIARAGAYNRTLTPFGFQSEDRTFWDAPKTYMDMSPFVVANKIKKPLLLIHGEEDNNSGTFTMQSERFYDALKGHGALTRLVLLPYESHGYVGRESVMHTLWEMDRWLKKFCVSSVGNNKLPNAEEMSNPNGQQDLSSLAMTGGKDSFHDSTLEDYKELCQEDFLSTCPRSLL